MFECLFSPRYSLYATGIKIKSRSFLSRDAANREMYKFIGKYNLTLQEVWDDHHYKTYICDNNVRFHINRVF